MNIKNINSEENRIDRFIQEAVAYVLDIGWTIDDPQFFVCDEDVRG